MVGLSAFRGSVIKMTSCIVVNLLIFLPTMTKHLWQATQGLKLASKSKHHLLPLTPLSVENTPVVSVVNAADNKQKDKNKTMKIIINQSVGHVGLKVIN